MAHRLSSSTESWCLAAHFHKNINAAGISALPASKISGKESPAALFRLSAEFIPNIDLTLDADL
jgi:hypothetical protein